MALIPEQLRAPYNPNATEDRIYKLWEESGFFSPDTRPPWADNPETNPNCGKTFSMVLPPPNVTGTLHMGHAIMLAVEDSLVRFERMRGKKTLWLPGTDHAAIATASKVEADIYKKEKKTRHDLGREEFLRRVNAFAAESHDIILNQLKKMGSSLDWSREAYTLDDARTLAVRTAFKRMYDAGLIYRGHRIVNWDPRMQTTVSDDEIEWREEQAPFYYLKYGPFTIGTARPETKFGDKYVVMHPDDERYKEYEDGQKIALEWINGPITATIVKDDSVDPAFGTGVMTITPWHDAVDFDIAERHHLDKEPIIDAHGKLLPIAGEFAGMHIKKARPQIIEKLKAKGLLARVDEHYTHRVAQNSRGGETIEPQIKLQWFVNVSAKFKLKNSKLNGIPSGSEITLKELMRAAVQGGQIEILPDHFAKTYFHWIDNLRDWCISRQIWFGHRIPVYYCARKNKEACERPLVSIEPVERCPACGEAVEQDPDTLDTWFSSGLWTFSTLGWPAAENDMADYHPTTVLETGYDILFFWVARMILMTGFLLEDIPFRTVYLHGLVRDKDGRKMSKSLGNIIDPLDMIKKYGADATRMSLLVGNAPGQDLKLSEDKIRGYKHFANKVWNVTRFLLQYADADTGASSGADEYALNAAEGLSAEEKEMLDELRAAASDITENISAYQLHLACEKIYHYVWHTFADKILEASKPVLNGTDIASRTRRAETLLAMWRTCLALLHPFMPFITEELWSLLPHKNKRALLMVSRWPVR
ncbi:MAG: valine--tRNA ligase [Parcubacteria group bacterium]|nr:valine--tRNA ligase [Parcubacteria group bacterium]